jgi:SnoaL-like domain
MPSRARLDEFIAVVESGDHAGAIERYYTEDSSMQENASPPRVGRDLLVAHERGVLARMSHVYSKAMSSVVEGDRVAIHWIFELTDKSGKVHRIDEVSLQEWRDDNISASVFSTIHPGRRLDHGPYDTSAAAEALPLPIR